MAERWRVEAPRVNHRAHAPPSRCQPGPRKEFRGIAKPLYLCYFALAEA